MTCKCSLIVKLGDNYLGGLDHYLTSGRATSFLCSTALDTHLPPTPCLEPSRRVCFARVVRCFIMEIVISSGPGVESLYQSSWVSISFNVNEEHVVWVSHSHGERGPSSLDQCSVMHRAMEILCLHTGQGIMFCQGCSYFFGFY